MIRKLEDIESPFDMTDEELDHYGDEVVGNMPCDISILPMSTRARYLKTQTKHRVRAYIKDGELGVDFIVDDNETEGVVKVSDECMERLKGDNWREEVEKILKTNK